MRGCCAGALHRNECLLCLPFQHLLHKTQIGDPLSSRTQAFEEDQWAGKVCVLRYVDFRSLQDSDLE